MRSHHDTDHHLASLLAESAPTPGVSSMAWGVVTAVITGPPKKVTVTINGSTGTTNVRYQGWYTPTAGDVVGLVKDGKHWFCIGTRA